MCIKLHGKNGNSVVMDPFLGIGHAALGAINCHVAQFYGFEIEAEYIRTAAYEAKKAGIAPILEALPSIKSNGH